MNIKQYLVENDFSRWLVDKEQGRIEIKILPYLQDIEKGVFVEAGALDGLFMSNTKILEDCGWTGLLIEPSVAACYKCRENRTSPVENCALVSKSYPYKTITGDFFFDGKDGLGAWSSVNRNTQNIREKTEVEAKTLDSLLKKHNINHIDLLSLDVEGYELNVLKGIDFDNTDIKFIIMEINLMEYTPEDVMDLIGKYGYKNLGCLSNFSAESNPGWNGLHQDYLFAK